MTNKFYHNPTVDTIAATCGKRVDGQGWLRIPCPAHKGKDDNLAIRAGDDGGLILKCHSTGCSYNDIRDALVADGIRIERAWDYFDSEKVQRKTVKRTDNADGKEVRQSPGPMKGYGLLIRGDTSGNTLVVVEGESDSDAVLSADLQGVAVASWIGGTENVQHCDFTALEGSKVIVWPDNDESGRKAGNWVIQEAHRAGALSVKVVAGVGADKAGAADVRPDAILDFLHRALPVSPVPQKPKEPNFVTPTFRLRAALPDLATTYRYNTRGKRIEYRNGAGVWKDEDDLHMAELREKFEAEFGRMGLAPFADAINAICFHLQVDPFKEWLDSLPEWDGIERMDGLLHELFVLSPDNPVELVEWAGRFLLMGPVKRTLRPGEKLDEMPVLIGPQGVGKSTAPRVLLPPAFEEWFADGLSLIATDKEVGELVRGKVMVELSEMRGRSRADLDRMKAWLTRTDDGYFRPAYARNPVSQPRVCIIVGTGNDLSCLPNDPTGNRRFVAIEILDGSAERVRAYLSEHREQLWAEGLHRVATLNEHPRLPDSLKGIQADRNERFRDKDTTIEEPLNVWLNTNGLDKFSMAEAAKGIGLLADCDNTARLSRADQSRLSTALRAAGYDSKQCRIDGKKGWFWSNN